MGSFGRSCVKTQKFSFSQQIEKFPWQLRRGAYVSPKYYCESADCNWSLVVEPKRESHLRIFSSEYIDISLRREDYSKDCQSVDVTLTILDASNIGSNIVFSKEIHFTSSSDEEIVSRMHKNHLFHGYWTRLNRARFIPNDILTVKCEITLYETVEENYDNEDKFEDTSKYARKGFIKSLQWYFGIIACLFFFFWADKGFPAAAFIIIFANVFLLIAIILSAALKKIWKFIKSFDDVIYDKSRIPTDKKVKTN